MKGENQSRSGHDLGSDGLASPNFGSLLDQAYLLDTPEQMADLQLCFQIATELNQLGARALLVGGYVRDLAMSQIRGYVQKPEDLDFEVYGLPHAHLQQHLSAYGAIYEVGASFSVTKLRSPITGAEIDFSTPRRERVRGTAQDLTVDEDLTTLEAARRRDLTINTLALDPLTGELLDEWGGLGDLERGVLRATDPRGFIEDPLRVLRIMQFAGRFDFSVDPETVALCRSIELSQIANERVCSEWVKLLTKSETPSTGLEVARQLGILEKLHPEIAILDTIEQDPEWHPEGNVWNHTKLTVDAAGRIVREEGLIGDDALVVLFGALCHDFGKATTTKLDDVRGEQRYTAHAHAGAGVPLAQKFLGQLKVKKSIVDQVLPIVREHLFCYNNPNPKDSKLRNLAVRLEPASMRLLDLVCRSDANGRGGEWKPRTESYPLYQRSCELDIANRAPPKVVQGRHLISELGLRSGPHFKPILDALYAAQCEGEFATVEDGIAYYRQNLTTN